jgi:hypothetical protein
VVCAPNARVLVEISADTTGAVIAALARLGSAVETQSQKVSSPSSIRSYPPPGT